jgi:hypothetical protein
LSVLPDYELKPDLTYAAGQDAALEKSLLVLGQLDISRGKADDANAVKSKTH